jgi:predicted nucleic acid-binding protein
MRYAGRDVADAVVDASVWVSRVLAHDPGHERTVGWFDRQTTEGALHVAPVLLLAEVAGALARVTRSGEAGRRLAEQLARLPELRLVTIDGPVGTRAAEIAAHLKLRGADAVYVAVAERLDLPLVTWDGEQRSRARVLVSTSVPR